MKRKVELFLEGLNYTDVEETAFAHEWDFSDEELKELAPKRCPVCGAPVDVDDGVVHCTECEWELR